MKQNWWLIIFCCFLWQCQNNDPKAEYAAEMKAAGIAPEATSLSGQPLYIMPEPAASKAKKDSLLAIAKTTFDNNPDSLETIIWYGRRTAYLTKYKDAIDIYTKGLEKHPNSPELYRHRGHRYISTRKFDAAIADFTKALALADTLPMMIEPDGIPNAQNIPLSNLQFNITYHLALAQYLKGEYNTAIETYKKCIAYSPNPDLLVATADWMYMTYMRLGNVAAAQQLLGLVPAGMQVIENESYYNRIKMYQGQISPDVLLDLKNITPENEINLITQGYGVGNWYYHNGDKEKAKKIFKKIVEQNHWSAFGYIAAEVDLERLF